MKRPAWALLLAGLLGATGVLHLARPGFFEPLVPRFLGAPRAWVYASGVAELVCAASLVIPATRRRGAFATAALFVAVFPGNVQMALDADGTKPGLASNPIVAYGRLPLQVPLVLWALAVAGAAGRPARGEQGAPP